MPNQHRYDVRIRFEIVRAGKGLEEIQKELDKTEQANKRASKGILGQWTELRSQLLLIKFAVREAAQAIEAFWSSARGGAEINQLTESFERANAEIFKTPNLLNELSAASRGTVTEAKLMSGIMTVTAGVSDTLSRAFAENAGQLLTIAKAANRLNPVLGDTDFFYQSLTTGIKRSSYRILDNLGIVVRVGEANRRWADETGRTVESLTAEERQMALLNEVLRVGGKLVDQAGGSAESMTDAYDILTTSIEEMKNRGMSMLDEFVRPLIQDFADAKVAALDFAVALKETFADVQDDAAIRQYATAIDETEQQFRRFIETQEGQLDKLAVVGGAIGAGPAIRAIGRALERSRVKEALELITIELAKVAVASDASTDNMHNVADIMRDLGLVTDRTGVVIAGQTIKWEELAQAIKDYEAETGAARQRSQEASESELIQTRLLRYATDDYRDGTILTTEALDERARKEQEVADAGEDLAKAQEKAQAELRKELGLTDETYYQLVIAMDGATEANEYLNLVLDDSKKGNREVTVTIEDMINARVRQGEAAREAAAAEREAFLASIELTKQRLAMRPGYGEGTGDWFSQAIAGDLNLFTAELDNIGTHLVWVTDSTITQQEQVENLAAEYENIATQIHEYQTFARGATLSDEDRAEKIEELQEQLGILAGRQAQVGDLTGHYVETTIGATANTDALKQALLDAASAGGASAVQMAILGQTLGTMTPEMATHALQVAILQEGVQTLAKNYVDGTIGAGGLAEAIDRLIERAQAVENPIKTAAAKTDEFNTKLLTMKGLEDIDIPITADTETADTAIGKTQGAVDDLVDAPYKIDVQSNSLDVKEQEVYPLQTAMIALVDDPYFITTYTDLVQREQEAIRLQEKLNELDRMTVTIPVTVQYHEVGRPSDIPRPGYGGQGGLDFMVPSGYSNDTFGPIWASSGERVIIDPHPRSKGDSGTTITQIFNIDARGATAGTEENIKRAVDAAMAKAGKKADLTRRTL